MAKLQARSGNAASFQPCPRWAQPLQAARECWIAFGIVAADCRKVSDRKEVGSRMHSEVDRSSCSRTNVHRQVHASQGAAADTAGQPGGSAGERAGRDDQGRAGLLAAERRRRVYPAGLSGLSGVCAELLAPVYCVYLDVFEHPVGPHPNFVRH